ncbi:MAG: hypothetical protein ACRDH6_09740 [Actinomycetota bacterium]
MGGPKRPEERQADLPRDVAEELKATARSGASARALTLVRRAVQAIEDERLEEAVKAGEEAKAAAPRAPAAREVLGIALYRLERFRVALRELQTYRRLSGRLDQNHLIADCQRALGSPEKAVETARTVLDGRLPEEVRAEAAIVAAAALADLERFDEALSLLRRFASSPEVARPHDLRIWYVLGDVLERAGRRRDAAREFRKVVRHDSEAFDAVDRLAKLG